MGRSAKNKTTMRKSVYTSPSSCSFELNLSTRVLAGSLQDYNRKEFDWENEEVSNP